MPQNGVQLASYYKKNLNPMFPLLWELGIARELGIYAVLWINNPASLRVTCSEKPSVVPCTVCLLIAFPSKEVKAAILYTLNETCSISEDAHRIVCSFHTV